MHSSTKEPQQEQVRLTSERYDAFRAALEVLYIPGNISGRVHFIQDWPAAAAYVFGEELIRYDSDGTDDKARRAELEQVAAERQSILMEIAAELEKNSVVKGVLQTEYVEGVVKKLGRDLSLLLYDERFVDRFIPPPPPEPVEGEEPEA